MNVAVLRLNIRLDHLGRDRTQLRAENAALGSQLSSAPPRRGSRRRRARTSASFRPIPSETVYVDLRAADVSAEAGEPPDPPAARRLRPRFARRPSAARSGSRSSARRALERLAAQQHHETRDDPGRARHDLRPDRRPARDRRAGDDGLRRPAPGSNPQRSPSRRVTRSASTRTSSTRSCGTRSGASSTSRGRPTRRRRPRCSGAGSPASTPTPRSGASTRSTRSRRRCSATRASTTRASPGSSSGSTASSPAARQGDDRQRPVRPDDRRDQLDAGAARARRLPDARPHDPGEGRVGAARDGRAVARAGGDGDRARPADRRRPRDGDRAELRREQLLRRCRARCSATAPSPTPTSRARPSSSSPYAAALTERLVTPQTRVHAAVLDPASPTA